MQGFHGVAGIAYLEKLVTDTQDFGGLLEQALNPFKSDGLQPQEQRAARAFALVALAGELATEYKITGWQQGDATKAALACFKHWQQQRGSGSNEDNAILDAIRDFTDRYGDTRFTDKKGNDTPKTERAGWFVDGVGGRAWLFTSGGLKDATKGYDLKRVCLALVKAGWLVVGSDGKNSKQHAIQGRNIRVYEVLIK